MLKFCEPQLLPHQKKDLLSAEMVILVSNSGCKLKIHVLYRASKQKKTGKEKKCKQGNRGYMRKIHVTRQFFEASGCHGDFFEKTKKKPFLDKVNGSMSAEFQVYIVFRLAGRRDTIHTDTRIQVKKSP